MVRSGRVVLGLGGAMARGRGREYGFALSANFPKYGLH